jgi:hypothetical protein
MSRYTPQYGSSGNNYTIRALTASDDSYIDDLASYTKNSIFGFSSFDVTGAGLRTRGQSEHRYGFALEQRRRGIIMYREYHYEGGDRAFLTCHIESNRFSSAGHRRLDDFVKEYNFTDLQYLLLDINQGNQTTIDNWVNSKFSRRARNRITHTQQGDSTIVNPRYQTVITL